MILLRDVFQCHKRTTEKDIQMVSQRRRASQLLMMIEKLCEPRLETDGVAALLRRPLEIQEQSSEASMAKLIVLVLREPTSWYQILISEATRYSHEFGPRHDV